MTFVFSSFGTNPSIAQNQYLLNCPLPLQNQRVIGTPPDAPPVQVAIVGTTVQYNATYPAQVGNATATGTFFQCFINPNGTFGLNVNNPQRNYGMTVLNFPTGWFSYVGDTISQLFGKLVPLLTLIYDFLTIPASVTGIIYFNIVTAILLLMIGLGVFLAIRSGAG